MAMPVSSFRTSIFGRICWFCICNTVLAVAVPLVRIQNGTLQGTIMRSRRGREFVAFRGIPYAQPPLGDLRFEPPKPAGSWAGVRLAVEDGNACIQRDIFAHQEKIFGSEDCLYLNVYSPKLPVNGIIDGSNNYPVMIWLHGGAWIVGSGRSSLFGPEYLLDHDIVLVAPNYRLGPLGFLSTEDLVSPGNQGLKDQARAMRWVHENIAQFGGDANRVTIFGSSAGGASVHYHMLSPQSKGLFHRAISESGTSFHQWALASPGISKSRAHHLGYLMNCPTNESRRLLDCLKEKDPVDIIKTDHHFYSFDFCPLVAFRPTVEPDHAGAFFTGYPRDLVKAAINVTDVPWIVGVTSHEGSMIVSAFFGIKDRDYPKELDEKFLKFGPITMLYEHTCPEEFKDEVTRKIREFYFGSKKIDESTKIDLIDMYSDAFGVVDAVDSAKSHFEALGSPVYHFLFSYKGSASFAPVFGDKINKDYGSCHGDESLYLFPLAAVLSPGTDMTEEDYKMVDLMTRLWVNFAYSGNPTPDITPEIPIKWKYVQSTKVEYLHIYGPQQLRMEDSLFSERLNFWGSLPYRAKNFTYTGKKLVKTEL